MKISTSFKEVARKENAFLFLSLWAAFFAVMYLIPVLAIPGNDIAFQAKVYGPDDYIQLALLSALSSLVLLMQIEIWRRNRAAIRSGSAALGGIGILSGIFSSVFASASCALCVGALFGFLSGSTLLLFVDNRTPIFFAGVGLLLVSLYLSSRRLNDVCDSCRIV